MYNIESTVMRMSILFSGIVLCTIFSNTSLAVVCCPLHMYIWQVETNTLTTHTPNELTLLIFQFL